MRGLEPPCREAPDPKSGVYTSFTTSATRKKKGNIISNFLMVRPTRFERVTDALEGHCSIQLS